MKYYITYKDQMLRNYHIGACVYEFTGYEEDNLKDFVSFNNKYKAKAFIDLILEAFSGLDEDDFCVHYLSLEKVYDW